MFVKKKITLFSHNFFLKIINNYICYIKERNFAMENEKKETMKEKMHDAADKAKEKAHDMKENIKEGAEKVKEKAHEVKEDIKEKAKDVKEKVAEKIEEHKDKKEDKA